MYPLANKLQVLVGNTRYMLYVILSVRVLNKRLINIMNSDLFCFKPAVNPPSRQSSQISIGTADSVRLQDANM